MGAIHRGNNKFGLKLEDFDSKEAYKREYNRLLDLEPRRKEYKKKYQQSSKYKEKIRPTHKKWREKNRKHLNALQAIRRTSQLQRTPTWSEKEMIEDFYAKCPKGLCVDHILPLQGNKVSGLHVLNNLQYLTRKENSSKGNRLPMNINLTKRTA
jgi:5-methylcytosine-specific restriction endonuclease McrA